MSGLAPWIARGAALSIGVALVVGALALAWAVGAVLVLMFVAVILAAGLQPIISSIGVGTAVALLAVPIAATAEVLLEGLQAREVPVAQDPTSGPDKEKTATGENEHDASNAPGEPDGRRQRRGRRATKAAAEAD